MKAYLMHLLDKVIYSLMAARIVTRYIVNCPKRKMGEKLHLGVVIMLDNIILNEEYEITLLMWNNA
jgi:hypothetical protein